MEFLDEIFLDNTVRSYLIVLGAFLLILVFRKLLSHYTAALIFMPIHNTWKNIEKKEFKDLIARPLGTLLIVLAIILLLDTLNFPSALRYKVYGLDTEQLLRKIGVCIVIISLLKFILKLVDFIALILEQKALTTKEKHDDQLIIFFRDFLKIFITLAGILLLIKAGFNQDIGTLLTGLSIVGAALALAAKESLENLIASLIIFFDKPFYLGDTLKVNNVTGSVERIGLRSTRIRTPEKTLVTVPNKQMVDSIVDNHSMRSQRRAELKLELTVKTTGDQVEAFIEKLKSRLGKSKEIEKYSVFFSEFNKNGIIITTEYFTVPFSMGEFNKLKQSINLSFKKIVEEQEIEMATGTDISIVQGDGGPVPPPSKTII